ncbi:MAG: SdrD B-like domain-containing protein [Planctomycetota bacterium]|jgi:hypothetical protein
MKHGLLFTAILLIFIGLPNALLASDAPAVNLPPDSITVRIYQSSEAYISTHLYDVPEGYDVAAGDNLGWCVDPYNLVYLWMPYSAVLYSSCDECVPEMYPELDAGDWNRLNYMLNHKQGAWQDVQSAIWLTFKPEYGLPPGHEYNQFVENMMNDAVAFGADYVPGGGDVMAIVVFIAYNVQLTVFEWTVPPCPSVSGNVFIDALTDGEMGIGEPGLGNALVELHAEDGALVSSTLTDEAGFYEFTDVAAGSYSVSVCLDAAIANYFEPTTDGTVQVVVENDDVSGINFGFAPDTGAILDDFSSGGGGGLGYWKHQLKSAITGKGRAHVSASTLEGYLAAIEELALPELFMFDDSDVLGDAFAILSITSSDAADILCKHLLAAEFNEVAGLGLSDTCGELQTALIAWGEYLAANPAMFFRQELLTAKDIFEAIN